MTKWTRMRKRKETRRAEESRRNKAEVNQTTTIKQESTSTDIKHHEEAERPESPKTNTPRTVLAQIPRYAYLLGFFLLLSGIFHPLITPGVSFDLVIQGTATLFVGLVGGIFLFKAATSSERQVVFISVGFALLATSLVLIFDAQSALPFRI